MESPWDVHQLIGEAKEGSPEAMDRLLGLMRPHLESLARNYCDPADPTDSMSDLVQEAWLRAWQRLVQFEGGPTAEDTAPMFRAWVGQIVHRLGLNRRRDRRAQRREPRGRAVLPLADGAGGSSLRNRGPVPEANAPTPSAVASLGEEAKLVQEAIDGLEESTDRAIIRLRFFESLSLRQVAERLKLSYDKCRDRFEVCMRLLESRLGSLE